MLFVSLLSIFMEILFSKGEGPEPLSLTTGLVARVQCFPSLWLGTQGPLQVVTG